MKQTFSIIAFLLAVIIIFVLIKPEKYLSGLIKSISSQGTSAWPTVDWGISPVVRNEPIYSNYAYQLLDTTSNISGINPFGRRIYDAKLVRVFGDGQRETIIESLRNKFPNILNDTNQELIQYYFPQNSDTLYFVFNGSYIKTSMNKYHIYRYNVRSDEMRDLFVNRYLTSFVSPSPYEPRLMLAIDDNTTHSFQRLYLIDLETDNARMLVDLRGSETMASVVTGYGENTSANLYWMSGRTVRYGVYTKSGSISETPKFLEYRQFSI